MKLNNHHNYPHVRLELLNLTHLSLDFAVFMRTENSVVCVMQHRLFVFSHKDQREKVSSSVQ